MGYIRITQIKGPQITCKCTTPLSNQKEILSKAFRGHLGRAFLMNTVINIKEGSDEDRVMSTGCHTVRDIYCVVCGVIVGWKYVYAFDSGQKYKEGRFLLECCQVVMSRDDCDEGEDGECDSEKDKDV